MFIMHIEKSAKRIALAALAGSVGAAALAGTCAIAPRDRSSGDVAGRVLAPIGVPSFLLQWDGLLRSGLTPNPFTYGVSSLSRMEWRCYATMSAGDFRATAVTIST